MKSSGRRDPQAVAKHVSSNHNPPAGEEEQAVLDLFFSSDEESQGGGWPPFALRTKAVSPSVFELSCRVYQFMV